MDRSLGALTALALLALAVPGAHADDAPLTAGHHRTTLPTQQPRAFTFARTIPGSTLHVALWYVGAGDSNGEGVRLSLGTAPGDERCGTGAVFRPTLGDPAPLLSTDVSSWTDVLDHPCVTADRLTVTVDVPSERADRGRDATLVVVEEPPVSAYSYDLLPEPVSPPWTPLTPAAPEPARPGQTYDDAPVLADGTYALTLRPGRTAVVAVLLGWDQTLRAQTGDPAVDVDIRGPLLSLSEAVKAGGHAQSRVASYRNRDSFDPTVTGGQLAGTHYVLLRPPGAEKVRTTLTLATTGAPGDGVPNYLDAPTPATPSATSTGSENDDGDRRPLLAGAVAVVLALGALALRATRRAGRDRGR
ncbi:hypothetical protein GCM10022237_20530 [Nocardioides ginsengisoli]|uniref:Peptidase n=1 Tax=Nocardioides ginsengisoli TaxID=363868 RepID=A0ABW3VZ29_9ACTN